MSERLPHPDVARIKATIPTEGEILLLAPQSMITRLYFRGGDHPTDWYQFRTWGPTNSRFDHHPYPPQDHPRHGIIYGAFESNAFATAFAETFARGNDILGPIDRSHAAPWLVAFETVAPLRLLDLRSGWVTRAGGNGAISTGARSRSREWARVIHRTHRDVDGVVYGSSIWPPGNCLAIWERGARSIPSTPVVTRSVADYLLDSAVASAALMLGTITIP